MDERAIEGVEDVKVQCIAAEQEAKRVMVHAGTQRHYDGTMQTMQSASIRIVLVLGRLPAFAAPVVARHRSRAALGLDRVRHFGDDVFEKVEGFVGVDGAFAVGVAMGRTNR